MGSKLLGSRTHKGTGKDGITYVRCRICGDHRRVISARHLSKHEIDRDTYMKEYRQSPDQLIAKEFRLIQSSRNGYQPYGKKDWKVALRTIYKQSGNIFAGQLQKKYPHVYLQGVWLFGDWNRALEAAGFDPKKMSKRNSMDASEVIRQIQAMHKNQQPLYVKYVMKNHPSLCSAALRQFGTWPKALVAAGVTKKPKTKKLYRDRLSLLNQLSGALHESPKSKIPEDLKHEAEHYFGSLEKAIIALRKEKHLPGWNRPKIIAALSRLHRSKQTLGYGVMRRQNMALVSAAEAHFGSWGMALHASGIDPYMYFVHHTWRGPRRKKL